MSDTLFISQSTLSKQLIWVAFFLFHATFSLQSQETGDFAFAFVQNTSAKSNKNYRSNALLSEENHKYQTAYRVYTSLVRARGDVRMQAPEFVMSKNENFVAWMDASKVLIGLEEKSYNVCMGFGADSLNALAALLSHEITHYYEKHDWTRHFSVESKDSALGKKLQGIEEGIKHEAQADYLGGFLAVSSGFPIVGLMPRLLDSLYLAYDLPDTLVGYPSLAERKAMSENTQIKLNNLQNAFEMGNYLTILGCYDAAETYQHFLLKEFQSREIYNNAGVLSVLSVLQTKDGNTSNYFFPFELDPVSRLNSNKKGMPLKNAVLLQKAADYFLKAKELDPNYAPAYLNLSCVYALTEQYDDAHYFLKKAEKLSKKQGDKKLQSDILVAKGILTCIDGDTSVALVLFEQAASMGNESGKLNAAKFRNQAISKYQQFKNQTITNIEKLDSVSLDRFLLDLNVAQAIDIQKGKTTLGIKPMPNSKILVNMSESEQQTVLLQVLNEKSDAKTHQNIGRGTKQSEVFTIYQNPSKRIETNTGQYWIYFSEQIGFEFDENLEVLTWFTFRIRDH
jgi:tetratricopeptide (TPR) repeat protein